MISNNVKLLSVKSILRARLVENFTGSGSYTYINRRYFCEAL